MIRTYFIWYFGSDFRVKSRLKRLDIVSWWMCHTYFLAKHQPPPHYAQVYENNAIQTSSPVPHQVYYKSDPQYGWSGTLDYNTPVRKKLLLFTLLNFHSIARKKTFEIYTSINHSFNPELWWSNHHFGESIVIGLHRERSLAVAHRRNTLGRLRADNGQWCARMCKLYWKKARYTANSSQSIITSTLLFDFFRKIS